MRLDLPLVSLGSCLLGIACLPTQAKDWPQWGGSSSRNMVSDERFRPISLDPERLKSSIGSIPDRHVIE